MKVDFVMDINNYLVETLYYLLLTMRIYYFFNILGEVFSKNLNINIKLKIHI